jgi:glycosyltransferase involved in cell wall biosynthesis
VSATKILWCSPLPPTRSGIADYAAELIPHLVNKAEVIVLEPPGWERREEASWLSGVRTLPPDAEVPAGFVPLLHLGNNPHHIWVAGRLRRFGGLAVLHDPVLHHLLVEEAAAEGDWRRFEAELAAAHGRAGRELAAGRRWGYGGRLDPFMFPAGAVYLRHASAAIVHTRLAEVEVSASSPGLPLRRVPLAVAAPVKGDRETWRSRLGVGGDELLMVHLGFLTPAKGLDVILRSLAALDVLGVGARLVVVGEGSEAGAFEREVAAVGLAARVRAWGYANPEELGGILAAADLGLVPRYPTAGETSAAALRFLAAGKPVAVAGYRQFLELPREAASRIAPGRAGVADLVRVAARLARDPLERAKAGKAAHRAWVDGGHEPAKAAPALLTAVAHLARHVA